MKIFFIRHTEAEDDLNESFGGICDDHLIESGINYAEQVANVFSLTKIDSIFTSPYSRAKETAEIINKKLGVEIYEIYNLRERNTYGVLSGITKNIAIKKFAPIYQRILDMKIDGKKPSSSVETLPGGEIFLDLLMRIKDAFSQIFMLAKRNNYNNIIIVTHGGVAWAFFNHILRKPIELEKGEIIVLEGIRYDDLRINEDETKKIKDKLIGTN